MSKNLQEIANDVLKRYPNENRVYVTGDGQAFFDKSHAINHSRRNRMGKVLELESFKRELKKTGKNPESVKTVKELSETLKNANADEVNEIIQAENALPEGARKTVITAAEKRLKELKA